MVRVGGGPGGLYLAILPLGRPARAGGGRRDRPPGRVRLSTSRQQLLDPLTARAVGLGVRVDVDRELADLAQLGRRRPGRNRYVWLSTSKVFDASPLCSSPPTRAGSGSTPMASAVTAAPASSSAPTPPTSPSVRHQAGPGGRDRAGRQPGRARGRPVGAPGLRGAPSDGTALAAGGGAQQRPVVRAHPALHRPAGSAVRSAAEAASLHAAHYDPTVLPPPPATEQVACGAGSGGSSAPDAESSMYAA